MRHTQSPEATQHERYKDWQASCVSPSICLVNLINKKCWKKIHLSWSCWPSLSASPRRDQIDSPKVDHPCACGVKSDEIAAGTQSPIECRSGWENPPVASSLRRNHLRCQARQTEPQTNVQQLHGSSILISTNGNEGCEVSYGCLWVVYAYRLVVKREILM